MSLRVISTLRLTEIHLESFQHTVRVELWNHETCLIRASSNGSQAKDAGIVSGFQPEVHDLKVLIKYGFRIVPL